MSNQCKWFNACPMKFFYSEGKLEKGWIDNYCKGDWKKCLRFRMEERGEFHPDYMLPDGSFATELKNN